MNIRAKIFGLARDSDKPIMPSKTARLDDSDSLDALVARDERRPTHTRIDDRHRLLDEAARIEHGGASHEVQLINVSGGGAMVSGDLQLGLWDHVELHLGEHGTIECVVRWLRGERYGLEFAHETRIDCGKDEQAAVLREVIRRSFPDVKFEADEQQPHHLGADARGDHRHPLVWSGVLHHEGESTPVRLRNVSASGAMIEGPAGLIVGSEAVLAIGDQVTLNATVAWIAGDQAGLRFATSFDLRDLARSKPEVTAPQWKAPAYLQTCTTSNSPWDEHWGRLSVGELRDELDGFMKR